MARRPIHSLNSALTLQAHRKESFETADCILAGPPSRPYNMTRPEPVGVLVARFLLPIELLETQNAKQHGQKWKYKRLQNDTYACLAGQHRPLREAMPGRPWVRCLRLSSKEPDKYNDGFKVAIDALCARQGLLTKTGALRKREPVPRLNFFQDDSPQFLDVNQLWEYIAPGQGFGVIDIYTGAKGPPNP